MALQFVCHSCGMHVDPPPMPPCPGCGQELGHTELSPEDLDRFKRLSEYGGRFGAVMIAPRVKLQRIAHWSIMLNFLLGAALLVALMIALLW